MPVAEVVFAVSKSGLVQRKDYHSDMSLQALLLDKPPVWTMLPSRQYSYFPFCVQYGLQCSAIWRAVALQNAIRKLFANVETHLNPYFEHREMPDLEGAILADALEYKKELHALCKKAYENCWGRPQHGTVRTLGEGYVMSLQSKLLHLSVMLVPGAGVVLTNEMRRPLFASKVVQNNSITIDSVSYSIDGWNNMGRSVDAHSLPFVYNPFHLLSCKWKSRSDPQHEGYQLPQLMPLLRSRNTVLAKARKYVLVGGINMERLKESLLVADRSKVLGHPLLLLSGTAERA
eukprot:3933043-Rhodomonas_salina.1